MLLARYQDLKDGISRRFLEDLDYCLKGQKLNL